MPDEKQQSRKQWGRNLEAEPHPRGATGPRDDVSVRIPDVGGAEVLARLSRGQPSSTADREAQLAGRLRNESPDQEEMIDGIGVTSSDVADEDPVARLDLTFRELVGAGVFEPKSTPGNGN